LIKLFIFFGKNARNTITLHKGIFKSKDNMPFNGGKKTTSEDAPPKTLARTTPALLVGYLQKTRVHTRKI
jgi:hypothetical protein